ncbi:hypothetical protein MNB_SM-3-682 [hydrothermal vent metagenome]|uniref:Uncharacterized protein n=1 Tax=hydrothermal vent metagenome TaxID=652676 RepID=A0A1W1D2K9_9ZZZZ
MKKKSITTLLFLGILVSGCAIDQEEPTPIVQQKNKQKNNNSPVICQDCKQNLPKKTKPIIVCPNKTKVINYVTCYNNCTFPVTVRTKSICQKGKF